MSEKLEFKISKSTCVAARDVAVILGISPFQNRNELLLEKCNWRKNKRFTESMKRGVELENEALKEYCNQYNIDINRISFPGFTRHPNIEYIGGVPDGIYSNKGKDKYIIEIKCPSRFTEDKIPLFYENQIQVYMHIFNIKRGVYVEYIRNKGIKVFNVERNNTWWRWVLPIIKSFWAEVQFWRENDIKLNPLMIQYEKLNKV